MGLLDFIYPKYCVNCKKMGDYLCTDCFIFLSYDTKNICLVCGKGSYNCLTHPNCRGKYRIDGAFSGVRFNPVSKKLIYQFKYKPYLKNLGKYLTELLYESLIQDEEFNNILKKDFVLVPIPLSSKRFKKRGYNQSEIIAKELSRKFDRDMFNYLKRTKDTKTQVGLSREKRKENVKEAFAIDDKYREQIISKNVILVDDVLTTGSTFSEAAKVLKRNKTGKVYGVAFAKEQ